MKVNRLFALTLSFAAMVGCARDVGAPITDTAKGNPGPDPTPVTSPTAGPFLETFDGSPASPTDIVPASWDVSRHASYAFPFAPMEAMHGMDCSGFPSTHSISSLDDAVFQCRNHLMTAIYTHGYAEVVLTPNRLVDFADSTVVVSFDVSTLRTAGRDWIDLWITPFDDVLENPLDNGSPDLSDAPRRAVQIELPPVFGTAGLDPKYSYFVGRTYDGFQPTDLPQATYTPYTSVLTPSAVTRTRFELRLSRTHVKFGIPAYDLWWVDTDIPALGWTRGTLQLAHHSYHPVEESLCNACSPDTWHWDNVGISYGVPFTIIHADKRQVQLGDASTTVTFEQPAPANAYLRFAALAGSLDVSFDNGASWQPAQVKQPQQLKSRDYFWSYWTPIPKGTRSVEFRGTSSGGNGWVVRDMAVWSLTAP